MNIKKQQLNSDISKNIIDLVHRKYGNLKNFEYFLKDYTKALDFCINNENVSTVTFSLYQDNTMMAHTALIFDKRLPTEEAFFGFLEMPDDIVVFQSIWNATLNEARNRGISKIKGPVNGSIWHQYRCISTTDNSDFFKSELFTETYYYNFLKSCNPVSEITYHSGYRERFDVILQTGKSAYDKLSPFGFTIKEMDLHSIEQFQRVAHISRIIFKNSWGFVELNEREFINLYSPDKLSANASKIYLLYHKEIIIGFCSVFKEDVSTLICKTIAILPEYQGTGLGNALAFKVHLDAHNQGFKKIIYALVREDNKIKNFPKENAVIFRHYTAFEYKINQND